MIEIDGGDGVDASTTAPVVASSSVRASHAERAAVVDRLHAALGEGRLEFDETEERVAAVYAARYQSELQALFVDLPAVEPAGGRVGWALLWQAFVRQAWVSTAAVRGGAPTEPSSGQRRATAVVVIVALVWALVCLLIGFSVGLLG